MRAMDVMTTDTSSDLARDYVKSHGRKVGEVMTRDVISVNEATDIAEVAMLMETKRIKRVPVLRDGRLVGIISRANLVRALAATPSGAATTVESDDRTIRANLLAELGRAQVGQAVGGGYRRPRRRCAFLAVGRPIRSGMRSLARRRREHPRGAPCRRAPRAGPGVH